jgi:transcriptional regulator with XRE-family HTH domain
MQMFSSNLKRLRAARNLSQEEIAQKLHITRQTVSGWETGRCEPDIDMLKALADVLNVDVQELICGAKTGDKRAFDRRFLIPTYVLGGVIVLFVLFRILFYERLLVYRSTTYKKMWLGEVLLFIYPLIGFFTGGMFLASLHNLFSTLQMYKRWKSVLRYIGVALVTFTIFTMIGYMPFNIPFIHQLSITLLMYCGRTVMLYVIPFLAGGMLMLSLKE